MTAGFRQDALGGPEVCTLCNHPSALCIHFKWFVYYFCICVCAAAVLNAEKVHILWTPVRSRVCVTESTYITLNASLQDCPNVLCTIRRNNRQQNSSVYWITVSFALCPFLYPNLISSRRYPIHSEHHCNTTQCYIHSRWHFPRRNLKLNSFQFWIVCFIVVPKQPRLV